MLANLKVPLGLGDLLKRTGKEALADNIFDLGAQQAYYFFFALFPALLTLISIASFFPVANLMDSIVGVLGRFAPPDVIDIVGNQIRKLSQSDNGGILTFGFLLTLWSSSAAVVSVITTLNAAYDITEARPWWKVRLTAIGLTIGIAVFVILSISLVLVGPTVAEHLANRLHLGVAFKWAWWILQWPVVLTLVSTGIGLIYYFAPDAEQEWVWITPGCVLATILWIIVSLAFKFYIALAGTYNETYGTLGGVIVLLTWFYLTSLAILMGAEFNAEIEHASPYGKAIGEKVPGERKKIGVAAERDYEEARKRGKMPAPLFPEGTNCDLDRGNGGRRESGVRPSDLIIGTAMLLPVAMKIGRDIKKKAGNDRAA